MDPVNFLALVWGFSLIIICFALLAKPKHLKNIFVVAESETALLFFGMLTVVLGIMSVLTYNMFDHSYRTAISVLGWLMVAKGVFYLFMPEMAVALMKKWQKAYMHWMPFALMAGVLGGCLLIYFGMLS